MIKYEPLIVHLFKLFARVHVFKKEENKPTTSVSNKGMPIQPAKNYDGQNENMAGNKNSSENCRSNSSAKFAGSEKL